MSVVASSGVTAFYQWHQSASDAPYGLIPYATNATYTTPALRSTTTYWVTIRNSAGTTTSESATITILPWLTISDVLGSGVELRLEGAADTDYEIQYTKSLARAEWQTLTNVTTPWWGWTLVEDNAATGPTTRFYRAVALP
ncbi:MAG: hypothetical protein H7A46_16370 [Verrucomicrobiales bacterium]|nr:hypothetical protein [Verrucomicrobiales bacterium]